MELFKQNKGIKIIDTFIDKVMLNHFCLVNAKAQSFIIHIVYFKTQENRRFSAR